MQILHTDSGYYIYFNATEGVFAIFEEGVGFYLLLFQMLKHFIIFKLQYLYYFSSQCHFHITLCKVMRRPCVPFDVY
jgi:hypothetical protein